MRKLTDEEIQMHIETGSAKEASPDYKMYEAVFKELGHVPLIAADDLVPNIINAIKLRNEKNSNIKAQVTIALVVIAAVFAFAAGVVSINSQLIRKAADLSVHYKWAAFFVVLVLMISKYLDKFMRERQQRLAN